MAPAAALPLELIHSVLQADYLRNDGEPDHSLLRACTLVCKTWSAPAQQLLFSNVVLRSEPDFDSFCLALSQPYLATSVRSLRVVIDHNQPHGLRQHHLAVVVALCQNLNSISLALYGDDPDADSMEEERSANNPRLAVSAPTVAIVRPGISSALAEALTRLPITSFHLSNWSSNSLLLQNLLQFLPSVSCLSLAGTPPSIRDPSDATLSPCSLSFNNLRINFQPSPSLDFLRWLLDNSKHTLATLDFERIIDSDVSFGLLDHFSATQGPKLRSLILPSCMSPTELKYFQRCTNLRAVAFRSPSVSSALFKHLLADVNPTPLEEMYLCVDRNTSLSPVIEFVRKKDRFKSLVVCLWEPSVRKHLRLWGSLRLTCSVRGVQLKVVESLSEYKALVNSRFERV